MWYSCGIDLIRLKEVVEDLNLCLPEETPGSTDGSNPRSQSLEKSSVEKFNNVLHPHLKQTLLHCIRKNNLLLHVARGGGSWSTRYIESLLPRRLAEIPTPASAPAPALAPAPAPARGRALVTSPMHPPAISPVQVPKAKPSSPPKPFFPIDSSSPPAVDTNSGSGGNAQADKRKNNHKSVIIAVVVTAAVTFVLAALFFLCCSRLCRTGSGVRQNDERPLLSLSMSDYSVGMYTCTSICVFVVC